MLCLHCGEAFLLGLILIVNVITHPAMNVLVNAHEKGVVLRADVYQSIVENLVSVSSLSFPGCYVPRRMWEVQLVVLDRDAWPHLDTHD
ncbi:uncharacterized protein BCR38DRAFT_440036 [Pseudomassariella vexata]|uniref:Uncharacterized protein n=1 Tax=Pseudomassariella vexata TaxID=1141098 RepID=A0A1Y2DQG7_9PEZI|nr:uncharacterized protein BCR38DRAFT_440036 [Pseudomassariella vexata]ORY61384.1 hypothetical protein BCR38DRAFT_440036 [Pseudomassariella vexata]